MPIAALVSLCTGPFGGSSACFGLLQYASGYFGLPFIGSDFSRPRFSGLRFIELRKFHKMCIDFDKHFPTDLACLRPAC